MVSHWCLSDNKSSQFFRTLLSILADINSAVVWIVSTRPHISKSSSSSTNPLVTVPRPPITIGIIIAFMFFSFFNSLAGSRYLFLFLHSFNFILRSNGPAKFTILLFLFFSFVDYYKFCSPGQDLVIRLYFEILLLLLLFVTPNHNCLKITEY